MYINLDCPASRLGNRDVHDKVDGTADTLGEINDKDRYKNNKRTGDNMKKLKKLLGIIGR